MAARGRPSASRPAAHRLQGHRKLEELGLTESRVDEHDARSRVIAATPLAIEKVGKVKAENRAAMRERLHEWEPSEIALFAKLLGRLL